MKYPRIGWSESRKGKSNSVASSRLQRERLGERNEGSDDCCVRYKHVDDHQLATENLPPGNTEQIASCGSQKWVEADKLVCHPESRCPLWVSQPSCLNTIPGKTPSRCFCPPSYFPAHQLQKYEEKLPMKCIFLWRCIRCLLIMLLVKSDKNNLSLS